MEQKETLCPTCHSPISDSFYFCPNCGKNLKPAPLPTTIAKQIEVYAISFLLPPFGLWPAVKYLKEKNQTAKVIGMVAIILTIVSTIISAILLKNWADKINTQVNQELNRYQGIGY